VLDLQDLTCNRESALLVSQATMMFDLWLESALSEMMSVTFILWSCGFNGFRAKCPSEVCNLLDLIHCLVKGRDS